MSLTGYRYGLWAGAFEFWQTQPEESRDELQRHFEWLAAHPHYEGFACDYDLSGRRVFLSICGDIVVTYWPDHSVRMMQIGELANG